jgi:hypothetical protein
MSCHQFGPLFWYKKNGSPFPRSHNTSNFPRREIMLKYDVVRMDDEDEDEDLSDDVLDAVG